MNRIRAVSFALTGLMTFAALECAAGAAESTTVPVQQARIQLGQNYPQPSTETADRTGGNRLQWDEVEVQQNALPGIPENSDQAEIPFGFAGVAWSVRHFGEAERLFLPVLN